MPDPEGRVAYLVPLFETLVKLGFMVHQGFLTRPRVVGHMSISRTYGHNTLFSQVSFPLPPMTAYEEHLTQRTEEILGLRQLKKTQQ